MNIQEIRQTQLLFILCVMAILGIFVDYGIYKKVMNNRIKYQLWTCDNWLGINPKTDPELLAKQRAECEKLRNEVR